MIYSIYYNTCICNDNQTLTINLSNRTFFFLSAFRKSKKIPEQCLSKQALLVFLFFLLAQHLFIDIYSNRPLFVALTKRKEVLSKHISKCQHFSYLIRKLVMSPRNMLATLEIQFEENEEKKNPKCVLE